VHPSSQRDNVRVGNEPCAENMESPASCLHEGGTFYILRHRAKPATEQRNCEVGMVLKYRHVATARHEQDAKRLRMTAPHHNLEYMEF